MCPSGRRPARSPRLNAPYLGEMSLESDKIRRTRELGSKDAARERPKFWLDDNSAQNCREMDYALKRSMLPDTDIYTYICIYIYIRRYRE